MPTRRTRLMVEPESGLLLRWYVTMLKMERMNVRMAEMTVDSLHQHGGLGQVALGKRTSDSERSIDVVPPSTMYSSPADQD